MVSVDFALRLRACSCCRIMYLILSLRVLAVMVRGSMDYLFHLSLLGVLKENVVFAGSKEPANGGTFMVAPKEGSWDRVLDIIHEKE